jgi:general secretion pathway protein L
MAQRIVGIDLGTSRVKIVAITPKSRPASIRGQPARPAFDVVGVGGADVPAAGVDEDAAATLRERQGQALAELKRQGLLEGDLFVVGLPGDVAAIKTLHFPFNDRDKIATALPYALESEITLDIDDVVHPYVFVGSETRKDAEVMCAYARKDAVQEVLDLLAVEGIDPRHVELDALALGHLWDGVFAIHEGEQAEPELRTTGGTVIETADGAPQPATAIVDIGHRRTSVCIIHQGRVVSAHTVLHGGADATRALAREIGLSLDEAEKGKRKEAFIEVLGADAQFPEQRQISDVLKRAHAPLVRRLRQIVQATISASRLRVVKIILTGGGGRIVNLDRHLGEELNIRVGRATQLGGLLQQGAAVADVDSGMESALALAYALSGLAGPRLASRLDFRVGPFAWKGDYDFMRERLPALGAWAAALLLVVGVGSIGQIVMLSRESDALMERQLALCEQITGEKIDSTSRCTALIRERINGTAGFKVPEVSAVDVFMEVSRRLPYSGEIKRKITELDITAERVRLKGTTTTYEAIDTMVERLQGGRCFHLVEKGKARNINADTVEMNITINLDCAAAPGDGKVIAPPPAPTAASLAAQAPPPPPPAPPAPQPVKPTRPADLPPDIDVQTPVPNKSTPEQIEARRERLRQLREERAARRRQLLDNPQHPLTIRDRLEKTVPVRGADDEGDE